MSRDASEWWQRAQALEREDRLEEAERAVHDALFPNAPYDRQLAELYRQRTIRLLKERRLAEAQQAREAALRWISAWAAGATSGGERLAMSCEADEFSRTVPTR